MAETFFDKVYKSKTAHTPDVLSCLANLSNDEVFTPPDVVNKMLDLLPQELFKDLNTTFLDPACKTGVFLREIAKRLLVGLQDKIPDLQQRIDHIFHKQLFGIAITELTSLMSRRSVYCSKYPNGEYSVSHFDSPEGNIRFRKVEHTWVNGKCNFCGASQEQWDRGEGKETHAYEFIHTFEPEKIFNMKFDVIIGNPPYQMSDGGHGPSAIPIYQYFVNQAKKMQPRYLCMIIPARWYAGGRGLDEFRNDMINDDRIKELHDFVNAEDCFAGVEIKGGICYFLWDGAYSGKCHVVTHFAGNILQENERMLSEGGGNVFIRYQQGVDILAKVQEYDEGNFSKYVSSQKPFDLRTFIHGKKSKDSNSIKLYERGGVGYIERAKITKNIDAIDKYKVLISAAYNAGDAYPHQILGKPIVAEPGSCCTETYVMIGPLDSKDEAVNVASYVKTKLFRFLVMLKKSSQHAPANVYTFVPMQDFSKPWTDKELYAKYGLSQEEIDFIERMIKPME